MLKYTIKYFFTHSYTRACALRMIQRVDSKMKNLYTIYIYIWLQILFIIIISLSTSHNLFIKTIKRINNSKYFSYCNNSLVLQVQLSC